MYQELKKALKSIPGSACHMLCEEREDDLSHAADD